MNRLRVPTRLKNAVIKQADGRCEYCMCPVHFSSSPFAVDHIVPLALSGATRIDNLALACQGCNNFKYTKTDGIDPDSGASVSLYHPRKDRWSDHFVWSSDGSLLLGIPPMG